MPARLSAGNIALSYKSLVGNAGLLAQQTSAIVATNSTVSPGLPSG